VETDIEYKYMTQTCAYKNVHTKFNTNRMFCILRIMPLTTYYIKYISQCSSVTCVLTAMDYIQRTLSISYITISLTL